MPGPVCLSFSAQGHARRATLTLYCTALQYDKGLSDLYWHACGWGKATNTSYRDKLRLLEARCLDKFIRYVAKIILELVFSLR